MPRVGGKEGEKECMMMKKREGEKERGRESEQKQDFVECAMILLQLRLLIS